MYLFIFNSFNCAALFLSFIIWFYIFFTFKDSSLEVVTEAVDGFFDVYGEDDVHVATFKQLQILPKLTSFAPSYAARVSSHTPSPFMIIFVYPSTQSFLSLLLFVLNGYLFCFIYIYICACFVSRLAKRVLPWILCCNKDSAKTLENIKGFIAYKSERV